jgi:hypothetical protein
MSLTDEMLLVSKIRSLQITCNAFDGLTTFEQRRELVRGAVNQVPAVTYTVRDGKNITLAQQFTHVYRCDL